MEDVVYLLLLPANLVDLADLLELSGDLCELHRYGDEGEEAAQSEQTVSLDISLRLRYLTHHSILLCRRCELVSCEAMVCPGCCCWQVDEDGEETEREETDITKNSTGEVSIQPIDSPVESEKEGRVEEDRATSDELPA